MTAITEFLRRQKETDLPHRRAQLQKEWLDAVECLFGHIRSWLAEAQREKLIKIRPDKIKITEENLGNYTATFLVLTTARKTVKVRPIGSTIRTNLGSCLNTVSLTIFLSYSPPCQRWRTIWLEQKHAWVAERGSRTI